MTIKGIGRINSKESNLEKITLENYDLVMAYVGTLAKSGGLIELRRKEIGNQFQDTLQSKGVTKEQAKSIEEEAFFLASSGIGKNGRSEINR